MSRAGRLRRRYLVRGRVQGVGFRYSTRLRAAEMGLDGWVKNRPDGRVEAEASGPPEALAAFRRFLEQGPPGARVVEVLEEELEDVGGRSGFEVVF